MILMMKTTMKTINLTKEQNECVNYSAGDLLIKGVPGSGKSYIILRRALKIYRDNNGSASIKIFTYANTLVKYTDELLNAKLGENVIDVSTVDKYFTNLYRAMTHRFINYDEKKCRRVIEQTLAEHEKRAKRKHRFYGVDQDFWLEEFLWIQEKCLLSEDEYIKTSRRGRGSQVKMMSEADKKMAWSIYQLFCQKMRSNHYNTWPELYLYITKHVDAIPESYKVDYVFVDEAQDMTLGKMRALKAITKKAITIAADMNQKIYKTSFTWKEAGIDIQGRASKSLTRTFRSTKQIVSLAEDLAKINRKNVPQYYVEESHEAIIPRPLYMKVQAEMTRRAHLQTRTGKRRVYSGKYALSSIVYCAHCGDVYRRTHWNNRGKKSIVWRCVSRLLKKDSEVDCTSRTITEEELHAAVVRAVEQVVKYKDSFMPQLIANIENNLEGSNSRQIEELDARITELQTELMRLISAKADYDEIGAEITRLKDEKYQLQLDQADDEELRLRIKDLEEYLGETNGTIEYEESLVRRLINRVTVYDNHFTVEFKSGIEIDV